jgi:hypothetical protein
MFHLLLSLLLLFTAYCSEDEHTRKLFTYGSIVYCLWYIYTYGISLEYEDDENDFATLLYTIVS